MAAADTLTQADLDYLKATYGGVFNVKVGDPISYLATAYQGLGPGQINQDDPMAQRLVQGGFIGSAADSQGNFMWGPGANFGPGLDQGMVGGSSFLDAPRTPYQLNYPTEDFKSAQMSGGQFGTPDPITGLQRMLQMPTPQMQGVGGWERFIGPAIGMALGAGAGSLGMYGPLGSFGHSALNFAGQEVLGNKPNPLSMVGPMVNQAGGQGAMSQLMNVLTNWT